MTKYLLDQKSLQMAQSRLGTASNQLNGETPQLSNQLVHIRDLDLKLNQISDREIMILLDLYIREKHWHCVLKLGHQVLDQILHDGAFSQLDNREKAAVYKRMGVAYQALKQDDAAHKSYRQALSLDPSYAEVYANLGTLQTRRGEVRQAIACYRKALSLDPTLASVYRNLARLWE